MARSGTEHGGIGAPDASTCVLDDASGKLQGEPTACDADQHTEHCRSLTCENETTRRTDAAGSHAGRHVAMQL